MRKNLLFMLFTIVFLTMATTMRASNDEEEETTLIVRVGDVEFKESNSDVFGDGTVSYDADTRTLTFNNFNGPEDRIYIRYYSEPKDENDNPFNIKLVGDNNALFFTAINANMHIYGNGRIKTNVGNGRDAFSVNNTRLLVEECTMDFTGAIVAFYGSNFSDITMRNVDFTFQCGGMSCFSNITDLKLEGCYLEQPEGHHFDKDKGCLVNKDGETYLVGTVHIARGTTDISNISNDDIQMTPAYNISGQRVSSNYKGIVIENGKKKLNK